MTEASEHRGRRDRVATERPAAADVVEGPVGSANLVDPARNPGGGANLEALPRAEDRTADRGNGSDDRRD